MSFFQKAAGNIQADTNRALLRTIVADPDQTIGSIMDSLEHEAPQGDASYLIQAFREVTIGAIVQSGMDAIAAYQDAVRDGRVEVSKATLPDAAPAATPPATTETKAKVASGKKKSPKRPKKDDNSIDLSTPELLKKYEKSILDALKAGGHTGKADAISSSHLRKVVGGSADQARDMLNKLIEGGRLKFTGKARGTRYWRVA